VQTLTIPLDAVLRANARQSIVFQETAGSAAVALSNGQNGDAPLSLSLAEVAILAALHSPRALPRALAAQVPNPADTLARLVLGGVLEVKRGDCFLSGLAAFGADAASGHAAERIEETCRISELALHYALAARHLSAAVLAERLYAFNSLPRIPSAPPDSEVRFKECTGIDLAAISPQIGGHSWSLAFTPGWVYFRRGESASLRFKIYLCPRPEDAHCLIPTFTEVLGRAAGSVFKIAYPAASLARPDKIVAYLPSFDALENTLSTLVRVTPQARVQPVPFSAVVPGTSLFRWGVDPPNFSQRQAASWRSWLTRQVAETAREVPAAVSGDDAMEHLRAALRLRDIDPHTWLPRQEMLAQKWRIEL